MISLGDIPFVSKFIRRHLFDYNLTSHSANNSGKFAVFTEFETKRLQKDHLIKCKEKIRSGYYLKRLKTNDCLYFITNSNDWDPKLRKEFTTQLKSKEAISTFASLIVPPPYTSDLDTLDRICDTHELKKYLENTKNLKNWISNDWAFENVRRLLRILNREDPDDWDADRDTSST